jgi:hypothetical protein
MLSPLPRRNRKVRFSFTSLAVTAFPEIMAGRLPHCVFRGLLSVHSRYGLHTCQVTDMTLYTGGFSRFVTSTTAPIATGWNESCRAGFAPAGKPCLCTAHTIQHAMDGLSSSGSMAGRSGQRLGLPFLLEGVPERDCSSNEGETTRPVALLVKLRSRISPRRHRKTALASALRASPLLRPA